MKKNAYLIGGTASGIGRAVAELFVEKGYTVYGIDRAEQQPLEGLTPIRADITDAAAIAEGIADLEAQGVRLSGIISIAGMHNMVSLAEADTEAMRRFIEVNLIGAMSRIRLAHPLLCDGGRVIILTSEVATYQPMPFNGLYSVSKAALDCYAQALRQELNLIGQRVITVRPGAVATPLERGSAESTDALAENTKLYKRQAKHFATLVRSFTGTPISPASVARLILKAAEAKRPALEYNINRNPGLVLLSILPKRLQCFIIKALLSRK